MQMIIVSDSSEQVATLRALALDMGVERAEGYTHPAAALDWCVDNLPDLIVVDYLMRACDGLEFLRRLRCMPHLEAVPVLLMVPVGFSGIKAAAWKLGATDFLAKPVDPVEFVARTRNLLLLSQVPGLAQALPRSPVPHISARPTLAEPIEWRDPAMSAAPSGALH